MLFSLDPQVQLEFGYIQSSHQESSNKDDQQVYPTFDQWMVLKERSSLVLKGLLSFGDELIGAGGKLICGNGQLSDNIIK